jgi:ferredoxin/flavodoxin
MRASILTFSQTGNTLKTGKSIATGLENSGVEVDHVDFLRRKRWHPDDSDLIGIGSPVFENRPADVVTEFLKNSDLDLTGKKAFVFITSGGTPAKSLWHLAQSVSRTGATVIGGIQFRGACTFPTIFGVYPGRPNADELKHGEAFGHAMAANMMGGDPLPDHYKVDPDSGGGFYDIIGPWLNYAKKITTPLPRNDSENCDLCGNCVNECPTGSITIEDKTVRFQNRCIVCYRCWHVCPQNSISMRFSPGNGLIERLVYSENMERVFGNVQPDEYVGSNLYKDVLKRNIKLKYDRKNPTAEYECHEKSV